VPPAETAAKSTPKSLKSQQSHPEHTQTRLNPKEEDAYTGITDQQHTADKSKICGQTAPPKWGTNAIFFYR
jgi:hypothetical protein